MFSKSDGGGSSAGTGTGAGIARYEIRANEGEAAEQGVYFDDTQYDYMSHLRDLNSGAGSGEGVFVDASAGVGGEKEGGKGKGKMMRLEDALRESSLREGERGAGGAVSTSGGSSSSSHHSGGSKYVTSHLQRSRGLEAQQDIPDALAGFQPDMDPRLREVLEALDDDAYVAHEEEEMFGEIARDRREVSMEEFEDTLYDYGDGHDMDADEDDGWESDVTEKPRHEYNDSHSPVEPLSESDLSMLNAPLSDVPDVVSPANPAADPLNPSTNPVSNGDWLHEFSKFKEDQKKIAKPKTRTPALDADLQSSSILTSTSLLSASGRKKRRRPGALTSSTGYSMTSSALARTEGLTTLDRRFERVEGEYADDDDDDEEDTASSVLSSSKDSVVSNGSSQAPNLTPAVVRGDFDSIMDDFLGGYQIKGKKARMVKKGGWQSGLEQLDEVRAGLGPARVVSKGEKVSLV